MYAVLGEIEFDVVAYWDEFESTMGVDYTSHARIEGNRACNLSAISWTKSP